MKKSKEIKNLEWWIENSPARTIKEEVNESGTVLADVAFSLFSERGIETPMDKIKNPSRYEQLTEAKRWRGITVHEMWERGIEDVPYFCLLGGYDGDEILPRHVVDFMKREMFRGQDAEMIEYVYQNILANKNPTIL